MNRTPRKLYLEDQRDRNSTILTPETIVERDSKRRREAAHWLRSTDKKGNISALFLYHLAWIFHHGTTKSNHVLAKRLALKSYKGGCKRAGWLYAAATDRLLILSGKLQKFGTQYFRNSARTKWKLCAMDGSVSNELRAKYGIRGVTRRLQKL